MTVFGSSVRGRQNFVLVAVCLTIALSGAAGWFLYAGSSGVADSSDPQLVALGKRVYSKNCASCHGDNLEGQPNWRIRKPDGKLPAPPHDETGHTWHHPDVHLFEITRGGLKPPLAPDGYKSDMPAFSGALSDAEIWAVLAFIKSTWPDKIQARQKSINERTN